MAQSFYFVLKNGHDFIRDDEGVEATDLHEAKEEAETAINDMRANEELLGVEGRWNLIIRDERGVTCATLPVV